MQLYDMIEKELDVFRQQCNFTEQELQYFNLRAKGKSNIQIASILNISDSTVSKLARKVKAKMKRIV